MGENTNELIDFMISAQKEMEGEYVRIQKRATEDPGTAGDQGEENWATLLRDWLPPSFQIVTKGRILSVEGEASPQVDILILSPDYPKRLLDKKLYLAGGVLAAFECKVTIKSHHISDFFKTCVSIKKMFPARAGTPYKDLHTPILFGLLAHSHSWKAPGSKPLENFESAINNADDSEIDHPRFMPDLICISDLVCFSAGKMTYIGPQYVAEWNTLIPIYGENGSATSSYIMFAADNDQRKGFTPIGSMINALINKLGWEYESIRSLSGYFSAVGLDGKGRAFLRKWDIGIYSPEVQKKIMQSYPLQSQKWDEWSQVFLN